MGRKSTQTEATRGELGPLVWPEALCHSTKPGVSFGPLWDYDIEGETDEERDKRFALALDICAVCPVQRRCLKWAATRNESGVWGGVVFPGYPNSGLVRCSGCNRPVFGVRKEAVKDEPAGTEHFCGLCLKNMDSL